MKHLFIVLFAIIFVSSFAFGQSNTSTITTEGDGNTATATQIGSTNNAVIDQTANTSTATQYQLGSNNKATITQYGLWPAGPVVNNLAVQNQTGSEHEAEIRQINDSGFGNNTSTQTQNGVAQYARAWQFSWNSTIDQQQDGNTANWAEAYQSGNNNYIQQIQEGVTNQALVNEQTGGWGTGSVVYQHQYGSSNKAHTQQYGMGGGSGGNDNYAATYQYGNDNFAGEGYNTALVYGIRQWGEGNTATLTQNDSVNKGQIFQHGNDNTSTVTQNGGIGWFSTFGDYVNKADIKQIGNNNNSTVTQTYVP